MRTFSTSPIRRTLVLLTLLIGGLSAASTAHAQRAPGALGIGAQFGEPTGVSLKFYNPGVSYDFLAAWDLNDFFYLNGHAIYERHLGNTETAHFFVGPGAFVGFRDKPRDQDDDTVAGLSATAGLGFLFSERFELYGQVTPRIALTPATEGDIGGGIGFRVYF